MKIISPLHSNFFKLSLMGSVGSAAMLSMLRHGAHADPAFVNTLLACCLAVAGGSLWGLWCNRYNR